MRTVVSSLKTRDGGVFIPHHLKESLVRRENLTHQFNVVIAHRMRGCSFEQFVNLLSIHFDDFRSFPRHDSTGFPCQLFDPSNSNGTKIRVRNQEQFLTERSMGCATGFVCRLRRAEMSRSVIDKFP
jgi:hypothetical protein